MKLPLDPRLPIATRENSALTQRLYEIFAQIANAFNGSAMWNSEGAAAPSSGSWAIGDKVKNSAPVEAGAPGSKYVVIGWVYTASGWLDMRTLTGH